MASFFSRKSHEPNPLFISRFHFVCNIRARNFYQSSEYDHFLMAIELMLLAVNINFIAFSSFLGTYKDRFLYFLF